MVKVLTGWVATLVADAVCHVTYLDYYELFTKRMLATWMVDMGSDIMYVTFVADVVGEIARDACGRNSWRHY